MKAGTILAGAAVGVVGFVGYKVVKSGAQTVAEAAKAAKDAGKAVAQAPYNAVNAAATAIAGREETGGGLAWEAINKIKVALGLPGALTADNQDASHVASQGAQIAAAQEAEKKRQAEAAEAAAQEEAAAQQRARSRADFNAFEYASQADYYGSPPMSGMDEFLHALKRAVTGKDD